MVEDTLVMLEDSVIKFLRQSGTITNADFGDGPVEVFIVNGVSYVSTNQCNKYLVKQLDRT